LSIAASVVATLFLTAQAARARSAPRAANCDSSPRISLMMMMTD
jgi:hypothetical protein